MTAVAAHTATVAGIAGMLTDGISADPHPADPQPLIDRVWRHRTRFGITRMGTVTGLDRIGLPVVQVCRPFARSNSVSQGKGESVPQAAVSALMEALETWAAESIEIAVLPRRRSSEMATAQPDLFAPAMVGDAPEGWPDVPLPWMPGWDFLNDREQPVPAGLIDTDYRWPVRSDAGLFQRTTTGLAAGAGAAGAFIHAALEVVERHCVAQAHRIHGFFEHAQIDAASIVDPACASLLQRLDAAGFAVGLWDVPAPPGLDVVWCHVMDRRPEVAALALPAEGFSCAFSLTKAVRGAVLEAVQARMSAVSGARDDIDRSCYPAYPDRIRLRNWCARLEHPERPNVLPVQRLNHAPTQSDTLDVLRSAFRHLGARMAAVVPVRVDPAIGYAVLRVVAPDLHPAPHAGTS